MLTQVVIRCLENTLNPETIRISMTDSQGKCIAPLESEYTCYLPDKANPKWIWCYGKSEVKFLVPKGTFYCITSAGPAWSIDYREIQVSGQDCILAEISLDRIFDPLKNGWVSGDNHLHTWRGKQPDDFVTVFSGEDINFAGIQYWGLYEGNEHIELPPGDGCFKVGDTWVTVDEEVEMHSPWGPWEDSTVVGLLNPVPDMRKGFGYRMNSVFYNEAKKNSHRMIVYQAPTWRQFPVDVILGLVDSVNLSDNYYSLTSPTYGPWDIPNFDESSSLQKEKYGVAYWINQNYYRILNAGFRLPVSGGSAYPQGGGGGPVGMSRFYVDTRGDTTPDAYFKNWREGRTFVTNGPLLIAEIDGRKPSVRTMNIAKDKAQMHLRVISNRPVRRLEWIADGKVIDYKELSGLDFIQDVVWETELDLRQYHWVAARCFGESERTLYPVGGQVSPPFLTAHTSPFYLQKINASDTVRVEAANDIAGQINWMKEVVENTRYSPPGTEYFDTRLLSNHEKEEIYSILNKALEML